jgi:hypothetical protein
VSTGTDPFGGPYERPPAGMDRIGWYIATLHSMLGHAKTAQFIGQPEEPGDRELCIICAYERQPTPARRQAVIDAIGSPS